MNTLATTGADLTGALQKALKPADRNLLASYRKEEELCERELLCAQYIDNTQRMIAARAYWSDRLRAVRGKIAALLGEVA